MNTKGFKKRDRVECRLTDQSTVWRRGTVGKRLARGDCYWVNLDEPQDGRRSWIIRNLHGDCIRPLNILIQLAEVANEPRKARR